MGGFSMYPLVFIIAMLFVFFVFLKLLGYLYMMFPVVAIGFYFSKKYARKQKKSQDDLFETYFITNNQPAFLEDTHFTMSLLRKRNNGTK